jgi:hypothetical protein
MAQLVALSVQDSCSTPSSRTLTVPCDWQTQEHSMREGSHPNAVDSNPAHLTTGVRTRVSYATHIQSKSFDDFTHKLAARVVGLLLWTQPKSAAGST